MLFVLSVVFLYTAPMFADRPMLVTACIVAIAAADLWISLPMLAGRAPVILTSPMPGKNRIVQFLPALIPLLGIPSGFYFSDDALRHIQDGVQILRGVDVYAVPAGSLPNPLGLRPNQPQLGSIYLPTIQLLSVLGALINEAWGFRILFAFFTALIGIFVAVKLPRRHLRNFSLILVSPLILVTAASRHSDVIGALLVVAAMVAVRERSRIGLVAGGVSSVAAAFAKPEGFFCAGAVAAAILLGPRARRDFSWFSLGALAALLGFGVFTRVFLLPTAASVQGFRGALDFYVRELLAYHPLGLLRHSWGWSVEAVNVRIREEGGGVLFGILAGLPGMAIVGMRAPAFRTPRRLLRLLIQPMLVGVLLGFFAMRPVWHPWHFLWLVVALAGIRRAGLGRVFLPFLFLMYAAVPFYRAGGAWSDGLFWPFAGVLGVIGAFWFWLTKCRRWFLSY